MKITRHEISIKKVFKKAAGKNLTEFPFVFCVNFWSFGPFVFIGFGLNWKRFANNHFVLTFNSSMLFLAVNFFYFISILFFFMGD